jgi:hypothetical protein
LAELFLIFYHTESKSEGIFNFVEILASILGFKAYGCNDEADLLTKFFGVSVAMLSKMSQQS